MKLSKNLSTALIAVIVLTGIFIGVQIIQQYGKVHYGDVWIADLYVKTVDVNGNPIGAYVMVSEPYGTGWKVVKEKPITASGTFEYVGFFAPTIISGKQYRIDTMTSDMQLYGTVIVSLANGRNEIIIVLKTV